MRLCRAALLMGGRVTADPRTESPANSQWSGDEWHFDMFVNILGDVLVFDSTIDVRIRFIRKKPGNSAGLIETVRSIGYRLRDPGNAEA